MQTIKITITSPTTANVLLKKCKPEKQDVTEKLAELLGVKQLFNKAKKEK